MTLTDALHMVWDAQKYLAQVQSAATPEAWMDEWPADIRHALKTLSEAEWKLRRELRGKADDTQ